MSIRSVAEAWNRFFFEPQSPLPVALFRIFYGLLVTVNLILMAPDWLTWFGTKAWVSLPTMLKLAPGTRIDLFVLMPQKDSWIEGFFWVFLLSALLLTCGLATRVSSVLVFLCLTSIHQRNLFIIHSGDTFLRVAGFFLMFAPAGAALSIDRLIRVSKGKEGSEIRPRAPWAQRMIQFELALLYLAAFCWKATGDAWVNGTALYYVANLREVQRFPVPSWLRGEELLKIATWFSLALEFSLGVFVWIKETRYYVLSAGVVFHMILEYWLNVPLFQWEVISAYVLFVDPHDLWRVWNWVRARRTRTPVAARLP